MPGPMSSANPQGTSPWTALANFTAQNIAPRTEEDEDQQPSPPQQPQIPTGTVSQIKAAVKSGALSPHQPVKVVEQTSQTTTTHGTDADEQQRAAQRSMIAQAVEQAQQQATEDRNDQKEGIGQLQNQLDMVKNNPRTGIDFSPFVSAAKFFNPSVDAQSMEAAAQSIKPPTTQEQAEKVMNLQNMLQQRKEGLSKISDTQLSQLLKAQYQNDPLNTDVKRSTISKNTAFANNASAAQGRLALMTDNQTSKATDIPLDDKQLNTYVPRLQGANRILDQLSDVRSGKMVDTSQFLGDLNREYANLMTNSNSPALGAQERLEYTTAGQGLAGIIQKITADPQSIKSPEILKQIETGVVGMRDSYARNYDNRAALLQRNYAHNPAATKAQADKIAELKAQYGSAVNGASAYHPNLPAPPVDADVTKMSKDELKAFLQTHGG